MIKVIMERSQNRLPEEEINERLRKLRGKWKVISIQTTVTPWGLLEGKIDQTMNKSGVDQPFHLFYTTTVVIEKEGKQDA